jgi:hypothetical protein
VQRLPQVWFFSESAIYAQMIAGLLAQLQSEKILKRAWSVRLSPFLNEHRDLNYILEPQLDPGEVVDKNCFERLQVDLGKLGAFLESRMRDAATRGPHGV